MTTTPRTRHSVVTTSEPIKNKWSLAVSYWRGQDILETFAAGKTKKQTLNNWYAQYYQGNVPENPRFPSSRDMIFLSWVEFAPAE